MRKTALLTAISIGLLLTGSALAQDTDGDGVLDPADAFPCNGSVAGQAFAPAEAVHAMLQFEDQWPGHSDLDMNDVVLTYNFAAHTDGGGAVVALRVTLNVLALGGTLTHGLALQLPVPASAVASATLTTAGGSAQALLPLASEGDFTVEVMPNLRALFGGQADQINSIQGQPVITAPALMLDLVFAAPTLLPLSQAPYDLFIFETGDPGHEIHRPMYSGTSRMNTALFGTGVDASSPGRNFVDSSGLPYALSIPELAPYPQEAVPISGLFPGIVGFAASGGVNNQDFYLSGVVPVNALTPAANPSFAAQVAQPDLSCLPVGAPCANLYSQGQTTSGVYLVDPDGAAGLNPFEVYCDMNLAGGGWTLISNRRANSTNTEACGGRLYSFFNSGCGTPHNIGAADSYALDAAHRAATISEAHEVLIIQYLNGVPDYDDAYVMQLQNPGTDLFPNSAGVTDFAIPRVCTFDGTRCDSSGVYFKYSGDSWYHSSVCTASNWAGSYSYRGNYGLCHDAWTGASSSYFTGDRVGYQETKLWAHPNVAAAYQERIFYR